MSFTNMFSVTPLDYTGAGWTNGVQTADQRNVFFFDTKDMSQLAIKAGDSAEFVFSGRLKVQQVIYLNQEGGFRVFVTVDKPLNPVGDGFPNPVLISVNRADKLSVTPVKHTGRDWKNGILTNRQRNCFYFVTKDPEHLAVKAGDFAQFASSGRQKIQKVEHLFNDNGFFSVFITVDKALNPKRDGFPRQVQIHASQQA